MTRTNFESLSVTDRREYLETVAKEYGLDPQAVFFLAELYRAENDFDGLICALQDCKAYED